MSINFPEFENRLIDALRESGLIERFSISEINVSPSLSTVIQYFNEPTLIDFDENGIYFLTDDGDKVYCPDMKTSISDKGGWLSNKLPDITFDIDQSGNVRKADEAEALYICCQVANIVKESSFKDELESIASNYDYEGMKSLSEGGETFRSLLIEWQSFQSVIINVIVSASKFKISSTKKDTEKFLKDGIQESLAAELQDLEAEIRAINFIFSQDILSPGKIKNLTKIERLQEINKRDDQIASLISKSPVGDLYKATRLSSEYISPVKKKKISLWVQKEVDNLLGKKEFLGLQEDRKQLIAKFVRRAYRFEKNSIRKLSVERYVENPEVFKLPSKL